MRLALPLRAAATAVEPSTRCRRAAADDDDKDWPASVTFRATPPRKKPTFDVTVAATGCRGCGYRRFRQRNGQT